MSHADPDFYSRLPRKRVGAGALITDSEGRVLIVQPNYKPTWEVPGGIVEDHETAAAGCGREVREELGRTWVIGRLLVIEHQTDAGAKGDSIMCIYDGGVLTEPASVRVQVAELTAFAFVAREDLTTRLPPKLARRLGYALDARAGGTLVELEDGAPRG